MKTSKHEDIETLERQVRPWLERNGIAIELYRNLQPYDKVLLHDAVYARTQPPSDAQFRDLYRKLVLPKSRGPTNPVDSITSEELENFFSSLTPSERLHDLSKY